MRVSVSKSEIAKSVIQLSEYIGAKGADYEKVRAIKYDRPLVDKWINQALAEVGDLLDRLVRFTINNAEVYSMELTDTPTRPQEIEQSIVRYATYSAIVHWLNLTLPAASTIYENDRIRELTEIRNLAYYRRMPK